MFTNIITNFNEGCILKSEMLACINNFPKNFTYSIFDKLSEGIISGVDLSIDKSNIIIMPGIIKHKGRIYISTEKYNLPFYATGRDTIIKIRFIDQSVNPDFEAYCTEIFLDEDKVIKKDEIELGRYNLTVGCNLSTKYMVFNDFEDINNINILRTPFAGDNKSTLNPFILKTFAKEMLEKRSSHIDDISFSMNCLSKRAVERDSILLYIEKKKMLKEKRYSNEEIYTALKEILKSTM